MHNSIFYFFDFRKKYEESDDPNHLLSILDSSNNDIERCLEFLNYVYGQPYGLVYYDTTQYMYTLASMMNLCERVYACSSPYCRFYSTDFDNIKNDILVFVAIVAFAQVSLLNRLEMCIVNFCISHVLQFIKTNPPKFDSYLLNIYFSLIHHAEDMRNTLWGYTPKKYIYSVRHLLRFFHFCKNVECVERHRKNLCLST